MSIPYQLVVGKYTVDSGSHDGAEGAAVLADSGKDWDLDEFNDAYMVYNTTDESAAVIIDNTETTITGSLSGGTDNDWDSGDEYEIRPLQRRILRAGKEDFVNSGGFDAATEEVVLTSKKLNLDTQGYKIYWDFSTADYVQGDATVEACFDLHASSSRMKFFDDFEGEDLSNKWVKVIDADGEIFIDFKPGGILNLKTGTHDNDQTTIWLGQNKWLTPANNVVFEVKYKLPYTSWVIVSFGIKDAASQYAFYMKSKSTIDNFESFTVEGGINTIVDTGVNYRDYDWHVAKIIASATDVKFYIDDALVSTHTANIPTDRGSPFIRMQTTDDNEVRDLEVDYVSVVCDRDA